jgi:hypothetical protein
MTAATNRIKINIPAIIEIKEFRVFLNLRQI